MEIHMIDEHKINKEKKAQKMNMNKFIALPITALFLDIIAPFLFFFLAFMFNHISILSSVSIIFLLFAVLSPIAGIILGVISLVFRKKGIGRIGLIIAIIAIALPIIFVLAVVLLMVNGVAVIDFM